MRRRLPMPALFLRLSISCLPFRSLGDEAERDQLLLEAAQRQDIPRVIELLEGGADVNARSRYGATALFFACDKGNRELVEVLLDRGAEVRIQDTFYQSTPLAWTFFKAPDSPRHRRIALLLLQRGAEGGPPALQGAVAMGDLDLVQAVVEAGGLKRSELEEAAAKARLEEQEEIAAFLESRSAALPEDEPALRPGPEELESFAGEYLGEADKGTLRIAVAGDSLAARLGDAPPLVLVARGEKTFSVVEVPGATVTFSGRGGLVERLVLSGGGRETVYLRVPPEEKPAEGSTGSAEAAAPEPPPEPSEAQKADPPPRRSAPIHWPSFRGPGASGIGDGQGVPTRWDGTSGTNVRWKAPIPGIGLSSPIVWGDRVFVTTAVSEAGAGAFRTGLYGDVDSVDDDSVHSFRLYALDRKSGEILWQREAVRRRPEVKRHTKSSHANPTPATDGRHLVVSFGSEGLFVYDLDGELLWQKDLGVLSSGWFYDPTYEWGFASSPILHRGTVIVQVDIQKGSFLAAFDAATGEERWRTARDEIPSWATPAILPAAGGGPDEVVTNAPTVRGYDAATGRELWTLTPNSEIVVGTPVIAGGIAYVTGGYPPARPVYALKPGGRGDLTLPDGESAGPHVLWSHDQGGTYIPTPIVYRGVLYLLNNNGRLAAHDAATGELIYRQRVGRGESFSGSPVAADGRLFLTTEEGRTYVLEAGETYRELAVNELGEVVMTVPAISDGLLILRAMDHVYAIGEERDEDAEAGLPPG